MSCPESLQGCPDLAPSRGFTLLECMVAILILNMLVLGMVRLVSGHQQVLDDVDDWSSGNPTFHIVQDPDPLARAIGLPAALSAEAASRIHVPDEGAYEVEVREVWHSIAPAMTVAIFEQTELEE